jgi:hypothetical protein
MFSADGGPEVVKVAEPTARPRQQDTLGMVNSLAPRVCEGWQANLLLRLNLDKKFQSSRMTRASAQRAGPGGTRRRSVPKSWSIVAIAFGAAAAVCVAGTWVSGVTAASRASVGEE